MHATLLFLLTMQPIIKAEGLYKIHKVAGVEVVALQGIDLTVGSGEMLALVGPSGSGKSTLLNILGGLERPDAGRLTVGGSDLLAMNGSQLTHYRRRQVGILWQQSSRNLLPSLSARSNLELLLALDRQPPALQRAWASELLDAVGMSDHAGRDLRRLSGGQQQRVAIACALAARPTILLADEPTGEVDWPTAQHILALLRELQARYGLTIVLVTHDERVAAKADRIVAIRDGRVSSEALPDTPERAVIDSVGRIQLPAELRSLIGLSGHAQLEILDTNLLIRPVEQADRPALPATPAVDLPALLYGKR
jgi:ABC-type lipoprotein export system ATPase subunit